MTAFAAKCLAPTEKQRSALAHLAILLIIALPLFGHLDEHPLRVWDEMRNGMSALEISRSGSPIVTTFDGRPETWSTKPPLLIWIQALFIKMFGPGELAIRLPSAIAAALLCFAMLRFVRRRTGRWLPGLLSVAVLITCRGFIGYHAARYGDYDSLLTLFIALTAFFFFNFIEDEKPRWMLLSALCLTAAALTKGVAALFVLPAFPLYALLRKRGRFLFSSAAFYGGLAFFIVMVGGYYLLRNAMQPGYWQLVMQNELGARFNAALETHSGDGWFYLNELQVRGMSSWFWLLLAAIPAAFLSRKVALRRMCGYCLLCPACCLLVISIAATKLGWYVMPAYPFLAIIIGVFLAELLALLQSWRLPEQLWRFNFLPAVLLLLLVIPAYTDAYDLAIAGKDYKGDPSEYESALFLRETLQGRLENKADVLCGDVYPLTWYRTLLAQKGRPMPNVSVEDLQPGMKVMVWQDNVKEQITHRFETDTIQTWRGVNVYRIEGPKAAVSPAR